uniref:BPL/LPL catalytic domain-containing protein n=1 Tax=Amblyomma maculatum TaxID=34609 RepID=G3MF24_AMBMU
MLRTLKRSSASLTNRLPAFLNDEKRAKVLVSSSRCIYRNLALEQWLYENATFSPGSPGILLMWWNGPAVVIGRHQNPWVECSLNAVAKFGVTLARRNSGGGTVYHDTISGTAAKIGHQKAYHHCTILVDVNTTILHQVLGGRCSNIESKATSSVRASVKNLKELCPHLTIETLSASLAARFNSQHQEHATKTRSDNCIHLINPSEDHFPGINAMCEKLHCWDWIFGCTPRFTIRGSFPTPTSCTGVLDLGDALGRNEVLKVELKCYHGQIEDVRLVPTLRRHGLLQAVMDEICGTRFVQSEIAEVFRRIKDSDPENSAFIEYLSRCLLTLVGNAQM